MNKIGSVKWIFAFIILVFILLGPGPHLYWDIQHKGTKKVVSAVLDFQVVCGRFPTNEEGLEILLFKFSCCAKTWPGTELELSNGLGNRITYISSGESFTVKSRGFFDTWELESGPYRKNAGTELVTPFRGDN